MSRSGARFLLHLGCIEERGNDRGRSDAHRDSGLYKLGSAFFGRPINLVGHDPLSMAFRASLEAA